MKRALALVLGVAILLLILTQTLGTNTKATPNYITPTDVVENRFEVSRLLASAKAKSERKEAVPTPTPSPSPTPVATPTLPALEEEVINPSVSLVAKEQTGQEIAGVLLTYYDCDTEGYCGVTKSGVSLQKGGRYAACDPNYWPFGTRMIIVGDPNQYIWTCVDTGSAVIGPAHWDVWFYNQADGKDYLKTVGTTVTIKILP